MNIVLQPWQLVLAILSGWLHHRQQQIIEFQDSMIISLMQSQGKRRILLTDDQRRLLAVKGKALGRKTLRKLTTIVTPLKFVQRLSSRLHEALCGLDLELRRAADRASEEIPKLYLQITRESLLVEDAASLPSGAYSG